MNIYEVLEYGPIVAHDEDLDLLITVNGTYFNLWIGVGDGHYINVEAYDRSSRTRENNWDGFTKIWIEGKMLLDTIMNEGEEE